MLKDLIKRNGPFSRKIQRDIRDTLPSSPHCGADAAFRKEEVSGSYVKDLYGA